MRHFFSCAATTPTLPGPLSGVRVLDLTRILAGPFSTQLLGDAGAEVVKVESLTGDDTRTWGPPFVSGNNGRKQSAYFLACNRNKKSIAVDIKSEEGKEIVRQLAKQSDVFCENFVPGKLAQMQLGFQHLTAPDVNPSLIYASISGWGNDGPYARRAGYDVGVSAHVGLMSITGSPEAPAKTGVALTDISTGLYLQGAILSALFARERSQRLTGKPGKGVHLTTSLLEAGVSNLANIASNVLNANAPTKRWGTAHESIVPYQAFRAKAEEGSDANGDSSWLIVAAMNDKQFVTLCSTLQLPPAIPTDPRFATNADRVKNRNELLPLIQEALLKKTRKEWIRLFSTTMVTVTPVNEVKEALDDPQVHARGMVQTMRHEALGKDVKLTGLPVKYEAGPSSEPPPFAPSFRLPPPLLGEHTREILSETLGMKEDEVERLLRKGVVKALA